MTPHLSLRRTLWMHDTLPLRQSTTSGLLSTGPVSFACKQCVHRFKSLDWGSLRQDVAICHSSTEGFSSALLLGFFSSFWDSYLFIYYLFIHSFILDWNLWSLFGVSHTVGWLQSNSFLDVQTSKKESNEPEIISFYCSPVLQPLAISLCKTSARSGR